LHSYAILQHHRFLAAMKPQVTSVDVARLAAVSQSAVSRAFTPGASVSEDTRRKVMDAARRVVRMVDGQIAADERK
jgi:hypothetical protein